MIWNRPKKLILLSIILLTLSAVVVFGAGFFRNMLYNRSYTQSLCINLDYILIEHVCYYQCCTQKNDQFIDNAKTTSDNMQSRNIFAGFDMINFESDPETNLDNRRETRCVTKTCSVVCYSGYVQVRDINTTRIWNTHQVYQNPHLSRNDLIGNYSQNYPLGANTTCWYLTDYADQDNCKTCIIFELAPELMYVLIAVGLIILAIGMVVVLVRYEIWYLNRPYPRSLNID